MRNVFLKHKRLYCIVICLFLTGHLSAKDVANSKDHSLVTRYSDSYITDYSVNEFVQYKIPLSTPKYVGPRNYSAEKTLHLEGKITRIVYTANAEASSYQIYKNYLNALGKPGFQVVYKCVKEQCGTIAKNYSRFFKQSGMSLKDKSVPHYLVAKYSESDKGDVYVVVLTGETNTGESLIMVNIVETKAIELGKVETNLDALLNSLDTIGKAEIYDVYFDIGKSDIKPESIKALTAIAEVLQLRPALSLYVVGHTDDTGSLENNTKLSTSRATAIVNYLVKNLNIPSERLHSSGVGPFSPIASNETVTGRAKNRRVELVKRLN